jgi:hypothetical protein
MSKTVYPENRWRIIEVLAMNGWLQTRWRFLGVFGMAGVCLAINYQTRNNPRTAGSVLVLMWMVLSSSVVMLAGSGVKSQATTHMSFPEGLAQSTQFTISLPVSRKLLLMVRAGIGLFEAFAATAIIALAVWALFPTISAGMTPADFVRLTLATFLWLPLPYCAAMLGQAFMPEPSQFILPGYGLTLVLWLLHKISPAVDIVRAFGAASPVVTHRLPWSQLATAGILAATLLLTALKAVERREY